MDWSSWSDICSVLAVNMVASNKFFHFNQQCYQITGCYPIQSKQKYLSTKLIRTIFVICYAQFTFSTGTFFVFVATSMFEYGFSFVMTVCVIVATTIYFIFIWKAENIMQFIGKCERLIEGSKCDCKNIISSDVVQMW